METNPVLKTNFKIIPLVAVPPNDVLLPFPVLLYREGFDQESSLESVVIQAYSDRPGEDFDYHERALLGSAEMAQAFIQDYSLLSASVFADRARADFQMQRGE